MEWLILLLLVPAILVPIVLLCGFAGCSFEGVPLVNPPTVTAITKSAHLITVSWQPTDPDPVLWYRFVRKKGDVTERDDLEVDASTTTIPDTGLESGTTYTYQVRTNTDYGVSDPGTATAKTFTTAFEVDPMAVPGAKLWAPGDYCIVQRIPAGQLHAGGSKVMITVRGGPAGNVTINSIYISRAAGSPNLWDSFTDLTQIIPSTLTLPDDQPLDLYPNLYSLDPTQDLIIAFDFTATSGANILGYVLAPGVTSYDKAGVQQASVPTRDSDYSTLPDRLYLVVTIVVP